MGWASQEVPWRRKTSGEVEPCLPDAVLVSHSYARCKGVEFDHGGDAGVPVQKYLVVQSGDACRRQWEGGFHLQRQESWSRDQREGLNEHAEERGGLNRYTHSSGSHSSWQS